VSAFTPSAGPRLECCLGSAVLPNVSEEFDSARKGHALHAFLRALGMGVPRAKALEQVPDEFRKKAEEMEVPEDIDKGWPELGMALDVEHEMARAFRADMTREEVRDERRPDETGMLVDWLAVRGDTVLVRDYKIGWQEDLGSASEHLQLLVYAATALLAFDKEAARGELWHWDGVRWRVDGVTLDFLGALAVLERVRALLAKMDAARASYARDGTLPRLAIGKWCAWCPSQRLCPARQSAVLATLGTADAGPLRELTPEEAGATYARLKQVRGDVDRMLADLEALAGQTPLPLPDGTVLRQQEREVTKIDPAAADDWLRKTFGDATAGAATETRVVMTWTGLRDALRTQTLPALQQAHREGRLHGKKPTLAALEKQARTGLEAVGAVQVSTYTATKPVRPELPAGDTQPPEPGAEG
jgi:hypothetical protein